MPTIVSKEQYYACALEVLAESGFKGLNIGVLCKELGVTSGSFYHHFGNWNGFVVALLEFWENRQIVQLRNRNFGNSGPLVDFDSLMTLTISLPHKAEAAIRAWAANNEVVRAGQRRADEARRKTVERVIARIVGNPTVAKDLTALGMCLLVGYQQQLNNEQQTGLATLLDKYRSLILLHSNAAQPA
jgi:AcrR family transcriptional regulator